jgi:hypothetical protein
LYHIFSAPITTATTTAVRTPFLTYLFTVQ